MACLCLLTILKGVENKNALMILYNSLIKSYLTYCISSWYFGNTTTIHKLQCSVNKFIRLIFNLNYRASVTYIMKENYIMLIEKLFEFETANFMYRISITCYRVHLDIFLIKAFQKAILKKLQMVQMFFQNSVRYI